MTNGVKHVAILLLKRNYEIGALQDAELLHRKVMIGPHANHAADDQLLIVEGVNFRPLRRIDHILHRQWVDVEFSC